MADETSKNFQELIKKQIETNAKLQALVDQGIQDDTITERTLDALPEILNDRDLFKKNYKVNKAEGIFDNDELQEKTREEIERGNEILLSGIQSAKDREKVEEEYEKAHLDVNTKVNEGIISVAEGQRLNQKLDEERDEKLKGLIQPLQESQEDRNDFKRTMKKITGFMGGVKDFVGKTFGLLDTATMGALSTVGSILKNLFKGGLLFGALVLLQKFIDSPAFESMIKIINNVEKKVRAYIKSFEGLTFEEGVQKLGKDIAGVVKKFVKSFAKELAIGAAVLAVALGGFFLGIRGILKLALLPFSAAAAAGSLLFGGGKGKGKMPKGGVTEKSGKGGKGAFKMGEMNPQTAKKMQTLTKFGKVGIVGSAITGGLALAPDIMTLTDDEASAVEKSEAKKGVAKTSTGLAGATALGAAGTKIGAGIGTFIAPGLGTAAGGLLGGLIGGTAGFVGGTGLFDAVSNFFGKDKGFTDSDIEKRSKELQKIMSEAEFDRFKQLQDERKEAQDQLNDMVKSGEINKEQEIKMQKELNDYFEKNKEYQRLKEGMIKLFNEPDAREEILRKPHLMDFSRENAKVLPKKMDELIRLSEENNKLLSQGTILNSQVFGGSTNIQNNPTNTTVVSDTHLKDSYQYFRNAYG